MSTRQVVAVPAHAPDQPAKIDPALGVAVSMTSVPDANEALQAEPQLMPAGLLVTGPLPVPALPTTSPLYVTGGPLNAAVTFRAALMVTTQLPVPVHAPDQPTKVEPALGVAVSVTTESVGNVLEQTEPQEMPAGLLLTGPLPLPDLATVRIWPTLKVAVTLRAADMVTTQVVMPLQAPDQPAKTEPGLGAAVSVTALPDAKSAVQDEPQEMPAGTLVTGPLPAPALPTLKACARWKVATTLFAASMLTVQVLAIPLHAPDQPPKIEPLFGEAVNVTLVPGGKVPPHIEPQAMPAGLLVTGPLPDPTLDTVSVYAVGATCAVNMPRPWVAATSVVASYQKRWSTETLAGPSLLVLHVAPPSSLVKMPTSVPTYRLFGSAG
jgi:hypothetical protein